MMTVDALMDERVVHAFCAPIATAASAPVVRMCDLRPGHAGGGVLGKAGQCRAGAGDGVGSGYCAGGGSAGGGGWGEAWRHHSWSGSS